MGSEQANHCTEMNNNVNRKSRELVGIFKVATSDIMIVSDCKYWLNVRQMMDVKGLLTYSGWMELSNLEMLF